MNSILDHDLILKGKKVIVRVDLNVPMKDGVITEISRIIKILPVWSVKIWEKFQLGMIMNGAFQIECVILQNIFIRFRF